MNHEEFITLLKNTHSFNSNQVLELKEVVERYPYFVSARLLLAKALHNQNDIQSKSIVNITSVYCNSRKWFYRYIYPEKSESNDSVRHARVPKSSGNYFDMIQNIDSEGGDPKQSLRILADKLKEARTLVVNQNVQKVNQTTLVSGSTDFLKLQDNKPIQEFQQIDLETITEDNAKKRIAEHNYLAAIEILKALNLNNPKKSVYFADQIRFLEKVILNTQK